MRFSLVVLGLIINGSIGKAKAQAEGCQSNGDGCESTMAGYTYTINARKITATSRMFNPIVNVLSDFGPEEVIMYSVDINEDNPLEIRGEVKFNGNNVYERDFLSSPILTGCNQLDANSWDYVLMEVTNKGLTQNGACQIEAGQFPIPEELEPINVTFDSMISCGDYKLNVELLFHLKFVASAHYEFTIPNDGNCKS